MSLRVLTTTIIIIQHIRDTTMPKKRGPNQCCSQYRPKHRKAVIGLHVSAGQEQTFDHECGGASSWNNLYLYLLLFLKK